LASGSEVDLAIQTQALLKQKGLDVRVVSMPSHFLFEKQTKKYQKDILPKRSKIIAVEMGSSLSWYKYTQMDYGLDQFGISAPLEQTLDHFGFNQEKLANFVMKKLA
jgi:transketolase